jgi:hypothetical protein
MVASGVAQRFDLFILTCLRNVSRRATFGRIPLDEWSARRRELYLTTHNTHNRQTDKHPCPGWDSNPQSQQASSRRPTPKTAHSKWREIIVMYIFSSWYFSIIMTHLFRNLYRLYGIKNIIIRAAARHSSGLVRTFACRSKILKYASIQPHNQSHTQIFFTISSFPTLRIKVRVASGHKHNAQSSNYVNLHFLRHFATQILMNKFRLRFIYCILLEEIRRRRNNALRSDTLWQHYKVTYCLRVFCSDRAQNS